MLCRLLFVRNLCSGSSTHSLAVSIFQRVETNVALLSNRLKLDRQKYVFQCKQELEFYFDLR